MKCGMNYYIYNRELFCKLKEAQLNGLGMCEKCSIVSIPENILMELKEEQLEDIENRWTSNDEG